MKRVISLLMALVMLVGMLPVFAQAEEAEPVVDSGQLILESTEKVEAVSDSSIPKDATVDYKGNCSDELNLVYWELYSNGTLRIWGTGTMENYEDYIDVPWYDYRNRITTVLIEEGVRKIGWNAFYGAKNLTSITIPNSVTWISDYVFNGCSSLKNLTIPDSVIWIGRDAFNGCTSLDYTVWNGGKYLGNASNPYRVLAGTTSQSISSLTIHKNTKVIAGHAIQGCANLTELSVPNGVVSVGQHVVRDCTSLKTVVLPDTVTRLGSSAFVNCNALEDVRLSANLSYIDVWTFNNCTSLKSITIPNGVNKIDEYAFYNCTSLTDVTIPDSVTTIGNCAFDSCKSLTSITLPNSITALGGSVFGDCSNLVDVNIPDELSCILGYTFYNCTSLSSITIPRSVLVINSYTFSGCSSLETVFYQGSETRWSTVKVGSNNEELLNAAIHCDNTVSDDTGEIARGKCSDDYNSVFWTLYSDGTLRIWGSGRIKHYTYNLDDDTPFEKYETQIKSVIIENGVTSIGGWVFANCDLTNITIPDSVTSIESYAFYNCDNLTNVTIPAGVTSIQHDSFDSCDQLSGIWVSENNPSYSSDRYGTLYNKDKTILELAPNKNDGTFTIPNSVARIESWAFGRCSKLETVHYNGTLFQLASISIGNYNGNLLGAMNMIYWGKCSDNNNSLRWILYSDGMLYIFGTGKMPNYETYNETYNNIPWYKYLDRITSVVIEDGVTTVGRNSFLDHNKLLSVILPGSVTEIDHNAFYDCTKLTSFTISDNIVRIGDNAFKNCSIAYNTFGSGMYLGTSNNPYHALIMAENKSVSSVTIHPDTKVMANTAFDDCTLLTSVTIPYGLTRIGGSAFRNCCSLKEIAIPDSASYLGENAFKDCSQLTNVTLPRGIKKIPAAFFKQTGLKTFVIPNSVTLIDKQSFLGCQNLASIVIPSSVTKIANEAFENCIKLTDVYYLGSKAEWNAIKFGYDNYCLTTANIHYNSTYETILSSNDNYFLFKADYYADNFEQIFDVNSGSYARTFYEGLSNDLSFMNGVAVWETLHIASSPSYSLESGMLTMTDYYRTALFDVLFGNTSGSDTSYIEELYNVIQNEYTEYLILCTEELMDTENLSSSELRYFNLSIERKKELLSITGLEKVADKASDIEKILMTAKNCYDAIDLIAKYCALSDLNDGTQEVLAYIARDTSNPPALRLAASECATCFDSAFEQIMQNMVVATNCVVETAVSLYADIAWEMLVAMTPGGTAVLIAARGVRALANVFSNNDAKINAFYQVQAGALFEDALINAMSAKKANYRNSPTIENAKIYLRSVKMYQTTVLLGYEYSSTVLREVNSSALDGLGSASELLTEVANLKVGKTRLYDTFEKNANNAYVDMYDPNHDSIYLALQQKPATNFTYSVNADGETATITGYKGTAANPVLPELVDDYLVTHIASKAFANCSFTQFTIHDYVTKIADEAFYNCTALTSIVIPDSVSSIGNGVFGGCHSLQGIWVSSNNRWYSSDSNGVLYNKTQTELVMFPGSIGGKYTIPDSVTTIQNKCFMGNKKLMTLKFHSRVTDIIGSPFYECESLNEITFEGNAPNIGGNAFAGLDITVYYPACYNTWKAVAHSNLGGSVFWVDQHKFLTYISDRNSTCTADGTKTAKCERCNATRTINDEGSATGHSYGKTVTASTCTKAGYTTYTCHCGDSYIADETAALGHRYETVTVNATCTKDGSTTDTCAICGNTKVNPIPATGHSYANGICSACGEADPNYVPIVIPTLTLKAPTLEFKDMITVNAMFTAEDLDDVVEMGMITYSSKVDEWNVETAAHVIPGTTYDESTDRYIACSQGIHAKYLGDAVYLACYAKLTDGSYVYTKLASYSPVQYAASKLKGTDTALKQLVVAMLNYGAAAQTHFNHNVENLANATLTAEQIALPEAYRADMVSTVASPDATKQGAFANNKGFSKRYPSISFEGAFCINYFFTPAYAPVGQITLYYWNAADYEAADVLTAENASGSLIMELQDNGEYRGDIAGIAAKALGEGVYVAGVYTDGTTTWTSGVLGYSIGAYCLGQSTKGGTIAELAMATAVYGYQAKQYFG